MATAPEQLQTLADAVRRAIDTNDLPAMLSLMSTDVSWGPPDDPESGCHNKSEVRAWYEAASKAGAKGQVREIAIGNDCLLVGLSVSGRDRSPDDIRWQVLTIRNGLVADIRGYDDAEEAGRQAGLRP